MPYTNDMAAKYPDEIIQKAKEMYFLRYSVNEIRDALGINNNPIIYNWIERFGWNELQAQEHILVSSSRRYNYLLDKPDKTNGDYRDMEFLVNQIIKMEHALIVEVDKSNHPKEKETSKNGREAKNKAQKQPKNDLSGITQEDWDRVFADLYHHQLVPIKAGEDPETYRNRQILKSRQVGGTYGFAAEAFYVAWKKGHNQIFVSQTRAQAEMFRTYIDAIASNYFNIRISGSPSRLIKNGEPWCELFYLSPNSNAVSRAGDVYFDEFFYTKDFIKMESAAAAMATQTQYKKTYFSNPSTTTHSAYEKWSGEWFNKNRPESEQVIIDIEDMEALSKGRKDPDGFWRFAYTAQRCIEWGIIDKKTGKPRLDLDQLRMEVDPAIFPTLYECKFIDENDANAFRLKDVLACGVDPDTWEHYDKYAERPYGHLPCTSGYDPGGIADAAAFIVMSKPKDKADKFRLFVNEKWKDKDSDTPNQVSDIKKYLEQFNIEYMGFDATGPGLFVIAYIEEIFPPVTRISYSPEEKGKLVQKGKSVIKSGRFEYDAADKDLALSFMTIQQFMTASGQISYKSDRNTRSSHGDSAWAVLQGFSCEQMNAGKRNQTRIRVFN